MSVEASAPTRTLAAPRKQVWTAVVVLGRREAARILRSPIFVGIVAIFVLQGGLALALTRSVPDWPSRASLYEGLTYVLLLYVGLLTYAAAHLVTSSSRRTGAEAVMAASPVEDRSRAGAMCLGVLLGPGLVAIALTVWIAVLGNDVTVLEGGGAFSLAELAQIPLIVIGGGLFGVLAATWLRFPGSLPVGLVILIMGTLLVGSAPEGADVARPWFAPYSSAVNWSDGAWALTGSQGWHAVYLGGLCLLAVCGVLLRQRDGRRRWAAVTAGVFTLVAVAGWAQL